MVGTDETHSVYSSILEVLAEELVHAYGVTVSKAQVPVFPLHPQHTMNKQEVWISYASIFFAVPSHSGKLQCCAVGVHVQGRENAYTGVPTPLSMPGVEIASKTPVDLSSNVVSVLSAKNTY